MLQMWQHMCNMGQQPSVALLALYSTDFIGAEQALEWIFEQEEGAEGGEGKMQHPFIASLPNKPEFTETYLPYLDDDAMEIAMVELSLVCLICGKGKHSHKHDDSDGNHAPAEQEDMKFLRRLSIRSGSFRGSLPEIEDENIAAKVLVSQTPLAGASVGNPMRAAMIKHF